MQLWIFAAVVCFAIVSFAAGSQASSGDDMEVTTVDVAPGKGLGEVLALDKNTGDIISFAKTCIYKKKGTGLWDRLSGDCSKAGFNDGAGSEALFMSPKDGCINPRGDLIVADSGNACIRIVSIETGETKTLAGKCQEAGLADGDAQEARFGFGIHSVACLSNCSLLVGETGTGSLRLINDFGDCPSEEEGGGGSEDGGWHFPGWATVLISGGGGAGLVAMLYTGYCYLLQKRLERALQKRDEAFLPQERHPYSDIEAQSEGENEPLIDMEESQASPIGQQNEERFVKAAEGPSEAVVETGAEAKTVTNSQENVAKEDEKDPFSSLTTGLFKPNAS